MISKIVTWTSATLLVLTLCLLAASLKLDPRLHYVSLGTDVHLSVVDGRLAFFNNADYGPYNGSIISVSSKDYHEPSEFIEKVGFGDAWGIYYRYFRTAKGTLWTLTVSLVYPILLFAALPVTRLVRALVAKQRRMLQPN